MELNATLCADPKKLRDFLTRCSSQEIASFFERAAVERKPKVIRSLMHATAPQSTDRALFYAAGRGCAKSVAALLEWEQPEEVRNEALVAACQFGQLKAVMCLLPVSDPQYNNNHPLRTAATGGHIEVVRCLLPHTNPKDCNSAALESAVWTGNIEMTELLYNLSDPQEVQQSLSRTTLGKKSWEDMIFILEARRQKIILGEAIETNSLPPNPRKM